MDIDDPLDFEKHDPLVVPRSSAPKTSKPKVIGLEALVADYLKEQSRRVEREDKKPKRPRKSYNSDDDENGKEAQLSKFVNDCHQKMTEIGGDDEMPEWGLQLFGDQKSLPPVVSPGVESCSALESFMNNQLNSMVGLTKEEGCTFIEGLLINGWLLKLVLKCGYIEEHVALWVFKLMLYSTKEELRKASCDFWCTIFHPKDEATLLPLKLDWQPNYSELRRALEVYGFNFNNSPGIRAIFLGSGCKGLPQNIRAWFKFIGSACQVRAKQSIFSTSEAEELVEVIIYLFLDRQLQGFSDIMHTCMQSAINYFTDEEWNTSSIKIAKFLAQKVPKDSNCLQVVECIHGVNKRSKHLRSIVAYEFLIDCFDNKANDEEGILRLLISINLKEKDCDLFKMYICLILTKNWLLHNPTFLERTVICEMWGLYLRNCSCQISSTDLRSYASRVRNKASFLLQGIGSR